MSTVQDSFTERHPEATAGLIVNTLPRVLETMLPQGSDQIPFGHAVFQHGDGSDAADHNKASFTPATNMFRGIAVRDRTLRAAQEDKYVKGDHMTILSEGRIWVVVFAAVHYGEDASVGVGTGANAQATVKGQFSSRGADTHNIAISGARFMTSAAAGGLAQLHLDGSVHTF